MCLHNGWLLTLPLHPCRCQTFPALSGAFSCILCVTAVPGGLGCVAVPNWWQEEALARAETPPWWSGLLLPRAQALPVGLPCFWDEGIVCTSVCPGGMGCPTWLRSPEHLPPPVCQWRELHSGGDMERIFGNHEDIWKSEQPQGHEQLPLPPGWICLWQQAVMCPRTPCGVPNWGRNQERLVTAMALGGTLSSAWKCQIPASEAL